jgi:hypothetical protein
LDIDTYFNKNFGKLKQAALNVTKGHDLTDDLFQFCLTIILEDKDKDKIQHMVDKDQLHFYFVALLIRNYNSSTSRFHYLYRKTNEYRSDIDVSEVDIPDEPFDFNRDAKIEFINDSISQLDWYEQKMVELHFKDGLSYQKISELTGIPKTSCWNTIQIVRKKIITKYDHGS